MKLFQFSKNKYGAELLMDIGTNTSIPNYFFESELHNTDFFEIVFFTTGNGILELDQQKIEISDNTVVFISPFQRRKWFVNKSEINCHFLFFQDGFLSKFFSDKLFSYRLQFFFNKTKPLFIKVDNVFWLQLRVIFEELIAEIKELRSDSEHIIRSLLYFILIKLNREYSDNYQLSAETETNFIAFKFKQLLQNEITKSRNVDYYARRLQVSRVTLNRCVKAQFGIAVSEMINEFLIFEIKSHLLYSNFSIKEIAGLLDFSEAHHLTRYFKRSAGLSPTDFRVAYQNGSSVF
ncbi:helix-turn-helix transcriptional regulator [Lacibacter sp.]|uniref:helix-turn-helix domain-containing protein n=1 Tax=Lacibacter sp. TaxID=1915409 RepID=UPI002B4B3B79|nr:helix-turn-helix transcriptional regulator [Lacibacter sp.]HLP38970.1 helix-turn-helix transcriptional regulator [Lacibacter sp.]